MSKSVHYRYRITVKLQANDSIALRAGDAFVVENSFFVCCLAVRIIVLKSIRFIRKTVKSSLFNDKKNTHLNVQFTHLNSSSALRERNGNC